MDTGNLFERLEQLEEKVGAKMDDLEAHLDTIYSLQNALDEAEAIESQIEELESVIDD